ncbi:MAG: hypothetical protein K2X86_10030 [Cytophagaceae bacterium]|nr:hypothetical protein [Cytophagaceae bacterium]
MAIAFDTIRVGNKYYLNNFGERFEFQVIERKTDKNYILKDIHTLETYELADLVKYGTGKDYELYELE